MGIDSARDMTDGSGPNKAAERAPFWADLGTVPNVLSLGRIVVVLAAASFYLYGERVLGVSLGIVAGLTDLFDGYLARKLDQATELGAILDRLSDLVFETTAFVCIVVLHLMSPVYFFAYLLREFIVISARLYVAERGGKIATTALGRIKTNVFGYAFAFLFLAHSGAVGSGRPAEICFDIGYGAIIAGLALSYVSGLQYLRSFIAHYRSGS